MGLDQQPLPPKINYILCDNSRTSPNDQSLEEGGSLNTRNFPCAPGKIEHFS